MGAIGASWAQEVAPHDVEVWKVIILDRFTQNIFTWRLKFDGTYEEDAINRTSGRTVQPTFTGCWRTYGDRMLLKQNEFSYVFDGRVRGVYYSGMLYRDGRPFSRFCAVKGDEAPAECEPQSSTESVLPQLDCTEKVAAVGVTE